METKIGEYKGYAILYDSQSKEFKLENDQREEVGSGATPEALKDLEKRGITPVVIPDGDPDHQPKQHSGAVDK